MTMNKLRCYVCLCKEQYNDIPVELSFSLFSCFFKYNNNKSDDDDDDEETIDLKKNFFFFFFFKDQRLFFKSRSASVLILMLDGHQHLMQCVRQAKHSAINDDSIQPKCE